MNADAYDRSVAFGQVLGATGGPRLRIAIVLDDEFADWSAAQLTALALANIIPRISQRYTSIDFVLPTISTRIPRQVKAGNLDSFLVRHATAICSRGSFQVASASDHTYDYAIVIGNRHNVSARRVLHVLPSGWRCFARFGRVIESPSPMVNSLSCLATSAIAAMMIYREAEDVHTFPFESEVCGWSLFNYETTSDDGPPLPEVLNVGHVLQAGIGGTGNALLWALLYGPDLFGSWTAFEHEELDVTNIRYLLMKSGDAGLGKCELADREFKPIHAGLSFQSINKRVELAYSEVSQADLVLATVDDPEIRVGLQQNRAPVLLNVGTNSQWLSMSRHELRGIRAGGPCVNCFYPADGRMDRRQRESTVSFVMGLVGATLGAELIKNFAFPGQVLANSWLANMLYPAMACVSKREHMPGCDTCARIARISS